MGSPLVFSEQTVPCDAVPMIWRNMQWQKNEGKEDEK